VLLCGVFAVWGVGIHLMFFAIATFGLNISLIWLGSQQRARTPWHNSGECS